MTKNILIILIFMFSLIQGRATHLVGGEITYECLGSNNYRITLKIYRDCSSSNTNNTQFDANAIIGIYSGGTLVRTESVFYQPITNVPAVISNPCLVVPPVVCIEEAIYVTTVNLPPAIAGYDLVYQRCCRNPSVLNIVNPQDVGSTYTAHIPGSNIVTCNSSPQWVNYPPIVLCAGEAFVFDHSATDADGDDLVYEMRTPLLGGGPTFGNIIPNPPTPPPFTPLTWAAGYSNANQIGGVPAIQIDPATGLLTTTPVNTGIYTYGVVCKEYRNNVLISEIIRDFQFYVVNCEPVLLASIPQQTDSCLNTTVEFTNTSIGSSFYEWDFGDGNTSTDIHPIHTYDSAGTYTIQLIANPTWPCADTAWVTYNVHEPANLNFPPVNPECVLTNSFDFQAQGNLSSSAIVTWDFGPFATPTNSGSLNPIGVTFSDSGRYLVSLSSYDNGCVHLYEDTVVVYPVVQIDFDYPPGDGCEPYTIQFIDQSLAWTDIEYLWTFGDGSSSTEASPWHTYPDVGVYDVSLNISTDSGCIADLDLFLPGLITVNPSPNAGFSITPTETDIFNLDFEIFDFSSGSINKWYFSRETDSIFLDANNSFILNDTGWVEVSQIVVNEYNCLDTAIQTIYIEPLTTLYVPNAFSPNGDGDNDLWQPVVRDAYDYECFVFDRWGKIIWQTTDQHEKWDGTVNGKQAKLDVYVWQVRWQAVDRIYRTKRGSVTIVK